MSKESFSVAINTSQNRAQIMLFHGKKVIGETYWEKSKSHSEVITKAFQNLIQNFSLNIKNLEKVVCVVGPGSFTGIRVGVNFAKSLAYCCSAKLIGLNSLDLLSLSFSDESGKVLAVIDAQKNSVFCSTFAIENNRYTPQVLNQVIPINKLDQVVEHGMVVCGSGLNSYKPFLEDSLLQQLEFNENSEFSDLKNLFKGYDYIDLAKTVDWHELQPLYIKASAPEEKLNPTLYKNGRP